MRTEQELKDPGALVAVIGFAQWTERGDVSCLLLPDTHPADLHCSWVKPSILIPRNARPWRTAMTAGLIKER